MVEQSAEFTEMADIETDQPCHDEVLQITQHEGYIYTVAGNGKEVGVEKANLKGSKKKKPAKKKQG